MKKKFYNLSITKKTLLLLLLLVFLPLMIIGMGGFGRMYLQNERFEQDAIRQRLVRIGDNIAEQITKVAEIAGELNTNMYINELAQKGELPERYMQSRALVKEALERDGLIVKAQIISEDEIIWQYGARQGYSFNNNGNLEYIRELKKSGRSAMWSPMHIMYRMKNGIFNDEVSVITFYTLIYDIKTLQKNGILALHIKESSIRSMYENYLYGNSQDAWLIQEDGSLVSSTRREWSSGGIPQKLQFCPDGKDSGMWSVYFEGNRRVIYWQRCLNTNFYLVQMDMAGNPGERYFAIVLIVMIIFAAVFAVYILTYRSFVSKPLDNLMERISRARNLDLKQEQPEVSGDEIGTLTLAFQNMLKHIDELIDKVYVEKIKTQEAEQEAMLAQINPHFLYNTLDSIRWNALSHGERDVAQQLEALSVMLRNTLNFGQKQTTIEQEMSIIENYCFLLQARFRNEIMVDIQVEPELRNHKIPKLLIQPLVENAYKHGLENQLGEKKIRVMVKERKTQLIILVWDNGRGCDVHEIYERMLDENSRECFALKNIRDRIRLEYGSEGEFRLYSRPGHGTIAKIRLPLCEKE